MSRQPGILIAGLGSAHGDDRAGWLVAEQLASDNAVQIEVVIRKATIPLDLIDWLDGVDTLHVCDACQTLQQGALLRQFFWSEGQLIPCETEGGSPALSFSSHRRVGSHDFGLLEVLQLAETIGRLPRQVFVWAVFGSAFQPDDIMTASTCQAVAETTEQIREALKTREPSHA